MWWAKTSELTDSSGTVPAEGGRQRGVRTHARVGVIVESPTGCFAAAFSGATSARIEQLGPGICNQRHCNSRDKRPDYGHQHLISNMRFGPSKSSIGNAASNNQSLVSLNGENRCQLAFFALLGLNGQHTVAIQRNFI